MENSDIDILKMEYTESCSRRQYLDDQANKYVNYIAAFLGAIGAFLGLLVKDKPEIDLFAIALIIAAGALIVGMLFIMMLHYTLQGYRIGGYIRYLEEIINTRSSFNILKWESVLAPKHIHRDCTSILVYIIVGVFFVIFLATAGVLSVNHILFAMPVVFVIIAVIGCLEVATAIVYLVTLWKSHTKIYTLAATSVYQDNIEKNTIT